MLQSKCCYDQSVGHHQSTEDVLLVVVVEIVKCVIVLCFLFVKGETFDNCLSIMITINCLSIIKTVDCLSLMKTVNCLSIIENSQIAYP